MTPDELEQLREDWEFEAKKAGGRDGLGSVPASFWETFSAMANTEGGIILLGAKERPDGSLQPIGLVEIDRVEKDFWTTAQNSQKISSNVLQRKDVERVEWDEKQLLLFRIPKAGRAERPVYLNQSVENGTYVRVHEGDHRVPPDVARRMLADRFTDADAQAVPEYSLADLSSESVARYRSLLASARPDHPFLAKVEGDFLEAIGAASLDKKGVLRPTWAGMCMLGDEIKLRRHLPHWHLSFKERPADSSDTRRWVDRVHPDGTWNANLFEFYMRVSPKLLAGLRVPFAVDETQFRVDETEAHHALREALVNTLVHADHRGTTGIRISLRADGIDCVNPGLLLIKPEQLWRGGVSEARNPALQRLFGLLQLGEREGSGGPTMRAAWAKQHYRAPRVWSDPEHVETHLELPLESLLPEWAMEKAATRFGALFSEQDELGRLIVVTALVEGHVAHARLKELTESHSRDLTLKLQELLRKGLLTADGHQRQKRYSAAAEEKPASNDASSTANDASSTANDASSAANDASSIANDASSPLAQVRASRRAKPDIVQSAILRLCADSYLSVDEIADALNRNKTTVRNQHIGPLLDSNQLELLHPGSPTHPQQAYRAMKVDKK